MDVVFHDQAWTDYLYWQATDWDIVRKINELIKDCRRSPYSGIGKPERLGQNYAGWWSRRIDREHRLIYRVDNDQLLIAQCRYHYTK